MDTTMVREAATDPVSTVEDRADNVLRLLCGPAADGVTGHYFNRDRPARALERAYDPSARRALRALTDRMLAPYR